MSPLPGAPYPFYEPDPPTRRCHTHDVLLEGDELCDGCDNTASDPVDRAPMFCRFLGDSETCRMGLNVAEHRLTAQGFEHPTGLDAKGYWAFGAEAVQ